MVIDRDRDGDRGAVAPKAPTITPETIDQPSSLVEQLLSEVKDQLTELQKGLDKIVDNAADRGEVLDGHLDELIIEIARATGDITMEIEDRAHEYTRLRYKAAVEEEKAAVEAEKNREKEQILQKLERQYNKDSMISRPNHPNWEEVKARLTANEDYYLNLLTSLEGGAFFVGFDQEGNPMFRQGSPEPVMTGMTIYQIDEALKETGYEMPGDLDEIREMEVRMWAPFVANESYGRKPERRGTFVQSTRELTEAEMAKKRYFLEEKRRMSSVRRFSSSYGQEGEDEIKTTTVEEGKLVFNPQTGATEYFPLTNKRESGKNLGIIKIVRVKMQD